MEMETVGAMKHDLVKWLCIENTGRSVHWMLHSSDSPTFCMLPHHHLQDLQSLALHDAAVSRVVAKPELVERLQSTLARWLATTDARVHPLLAQWQDILAQRNWALALECSERGQQLRQASPMATVLAQDERLAILRRVRSAAHGLEEAND